MYLWNKIGYIAEKLQLSALQKCREGILRELSAKYNKGGNSCKKSDSVKSLIKPLRKYPEVQLKDGSTIF